MRLLNLTITVVFVLIMSYSFAGAQELLMLADETCNTGEGASNTSLYRVNPDTAEAELIGPTGFDGVGALAQIGDGRLIAAGRADEEGNRVAILIEINPFNGNGRLIGEVGRRNGPGCGRINDLVYDPVSDTLYATGIQCDPGGGGDFIVRLLTIDPDTGTGTIVGSTGIENAGNALVFTNDGTLITSGGCSNRNYSINPLNGQATFLSDGPQCTPLINSAVLNPFTRELLGTNNDFPITDLVTFDPFTGVVNTIGNLPDCSDGMTFFEIGTRPIPTLSEWGLIAMAGVLGIIGLIAVRRRMAA